MQFITMTRSKNTSSLSDIVCPRHSQEVVSLQALFLQLRIIISVWALLYVEEVQSGEEDEKVPHPSSGGVY